MKTKVLFNPGLPEELKKLPEKATEGSAGYDIVSAESVRIFPHTTRLVKSTFSLEIPKGYVAMVCSRSGMALKHGVFVLNAPGIVDSDYRGNVGVILHNTSQFDYNINPGDRIAQVVFVKHADADFVEVDKFKETERGNGGFGSTGK